MKKPVMVSNRFTTGFMKQMDSLTNCFETETGLNAPNSPLGWRYILFMSPIINSNNKYTLLLLSINDPRMMCKGLCNNLAYNQCDSGVLVNSRKPSD